jgi:hypothetical protein
VVELSCPSVAMELLQMLPCLWPMSALSAIWLHTVRKGRWGRGKVPDTIRGFEAVSSLCSGLWLLRSGRGGGLFTGVSGGDGGDVNISMVDVNLVQNTAYGEINLRLFNSAVACVKLCTRSAGSPHPFFAADGGGLCVVTSGAFVSSIALFGVLALRNSVEGECCAAAPIIFFMCWSAPSVPVRGMLCVLCR